MKLLTSLLILAATAIASPIARATKQFQLKTTASSQAAHNNLYVYTYHTGAGLNDAVLDQDVTKAPKIYLNGTKALFDLGSDFPWGMVAVGDTNYAGTSFLIPQIPFQFFARLV